MPDAAFSVHPPPFDYHHPVYLAAAHEAKARSRGRCRLCGRKAPLHAHHWGRPPYPPPHKTTAADLTALCLCCHITAHLGIFFECAGGSPETFCAAVSETVATLLLRGMLPASPSRVGRVVWGGRRLGRARHRHVETTRRRDLRALPPLEGKMAERRRDRSPRRPAGMLARAQAVSLQQRGPSSADRATSSRRLTRGHPAANRRDGTPTGWPSCRFTGTGPVGPMTRESAEVAMTWVRSNAKRLAGAARDRRFDGRARAPRRNRSADSQGSEGGALPERGSGGASADGAGRSSGGSSWR